MSDVACVNFTTWMVISYTITIYYYADAVTLSPEAVAPVCQDGDPLELTCITNGSFMRWNITARNRLGTFQDYGPLFVSAEDATQQTSSATVDYSTFTTMRISDQGSLPLISTMVINPVNRDLNGTIVNCEDVGTSMTHTASVASTTIHYVDKSMFHNTVKHTLINHYSLC